MFMPIALLWVRKRIVVYPAAGSSVGDAAKVVRLAIQQKGSLRLKEDSWDLAKPSTMRENGEYDIVASKHKAGWISWDDQFVDEVKATVKALRVFILFPFWYMADGGTNSILTSMAGSMTTNGLPSESGMKLTAGESAETHQTTCCRTSTHCRPSLPFRSTTTSCIPHSERWV